MDDSDDRPSTGEPPAGPPWALAAAVVSVQAFGKAGDALAPALVHARPRVLLVLNANDLICVLTARAVPLASWFPLALARRLAEDPVFFYVGWRYRAAGERWLRARGFPGVSRLGRRSLAAACVLEPNAVVCALAGAARTPPLLFAALNVGGTVARLALLRWLAARGGARLDAALAVAHTYARGLLAAAAAATLLPLLLARRRPAANAR